MEALDPGRAEGHVVSLRPEGNEHFLAFMPAKWPSDHMVCSSDAVGSTGVDRARGPNGIRAFPTTVTNVSSMTKTQVDSMIELCSSLDS